MFAETGLVVDGDVAFAQGLKQVLGDARIALEHARGLAEARALLVRAPAPPRHVFLNPELQDGDGTDLLHELRSLRPQPLVAIVCEPGWLTAEHVLSLQGQCVVAIPKPLGDEDVAHLIGVLRAADTLSDAVELLARDSRLSRNETRLLHLIVVDGMNNDEAAGELGCARPTVSTYWNRIFEKTGYHCARDVISSVVRYRYAAESSGATESAHESGVHPVRTAETGRSCTLGRKQGRGAG
jgi:DNA-binding NarL/FixJ family response regulator